MEIGHSHRTVAVSLQAGYTDGGVPGEAGGGGINGQWKADQQRPGRHW